MQNHSESYYSTPEYGNEPSELDIKLATIIEVTNQTRSTFDDFRGRRNFSEEEITRDERRLADKESFQTGEHDLNADALEGIITYLGDNDELFHVPAYAEPGHPFDDSFNGVDVVVGLPGKPGEYDTVFSLDVCSSISPMAVQRKFDRSEEATNRRPDIPNTSMIKYFAHENRRTRISDAPHYIVDTRVATICNAMDKFTFTDNGDIQHQPDPDLQEKLLIELLYQSAAGFYAADNVPPSQKGNRTDEVKGAHQKVYGACRTTLEHLWHIEKNTTTKASIKPCNPPYKKTQRRRHLRPHHKTFYR